MLKFANSEEDPGVLDLQHQALSHIERRDAGLPVPRVIRTKAGELSDIVEGPDGRRHIVRLLGYMPGTDLSAVAQTPELHRNLGATLARLDVALRGFFHPAADHVLLWDLKRAPELRRNTDVIADDTLRARVEGILDRFTDDVLPRLGRPARPDHPQRRQRRQRAGRPRTTLSASPASSTTATWCTAR